MQRQVQPGQRVMTTAGMIATVVALEDNEVVLEIAPGVEARFVRQAIGQVLPDDDEEEDIEDEVDEDVEDESEETEEEEAKTEGDDASKTRETLEDDVEAKTETLPGAKGKKTEDARSKALSAGLVSATVTLLSLRLAVPRDSSASESSV